MIGTPIKLINYLYQQDSEKQFEIKEVKRKRSLSQNAYAWKLITEIGNVLRKSKEEIYLQMLIDYGVSEEILMLSGIEPKGYFKYFKAISKIKKDDKEFIVYRIYKGSSEFDSKEMSIFIDGIIQECQNLDIETLTPDEIKRWELV